MAASYEIETLAACPLCSGRVLVALPTMAGLRAIWDFFRPRVELETWSEGGPDVAVEVELEPPEKVKPPRAASGSG